MWYPMDAPYKDLPGGIFSERWPWGRVNGAITLSFTDNGKAGKVEKPFEWIVSLLQRLYDTTESEFTRQRIRQYMSRRTCPVCHGARPEAGAVLAITVQRPRYLLHADSNSVAKAPPIGALGWAGRALSPASS